MARVAVVGAGISGLAAAYALRRAGLSETDILVLEAAHAAGGKLRTSQIAGITVDEGADAIVARSADGMDLVREVGLGDDLVPALTTAAGIVARQRIHPIPSGTVFGIPGDLAALRASTVLTSPAVNRVIAEPTQVWPPITSDVSVGSLVLAQLGTEVLDHLVDPVFGGIYAGQATELSLYATMPEMAKALREQGSLVRAAQHVTSAAPVSDGHLFHTIRGGLATLPAAIVERAGLNVRHGLPVRVVRRRGTEYELLAGPATEPVRFVTDGVIIAAPARKAAGMLASVSPWAASELEQIEYASVAIVTLAYHEANLPSGSGLLIAPDEGRSVKAITFSSQKWPHLRTAPSVIVRASLGRYGETRLWQRDDKELAELAARDVAAITGMTVLPIASRVTRWGAGLPQYAVGHVDRVRRIREDLHRHPRLTVCGAAYDGIGIAACIRSGRSAAAHILSQLSPAQ